ncbi:major facilitator superfamily domain-containing protein [Apiospora aurea]|uniref:Major facilitator superfamily domain-containing protein n=1 Tax=Apiospora aurea TaxID=335848 RepID=A0ABR1QAC8_9PEZI
MAEKVDEEKAFGRSVGSGSASTAGESPVLGRDFSYTQHIETQHHQGQRQQQGLRDAGSEPTAAVIIVTEPEAWAAARQFPDRALPLRLTLSPPTPTTRATGPSGAGGTSATSISSGAHQTQTEFGASEEVTTLGLSLYVLGFALGPLLLAPLSELRGRRGVYISSWLCVVLLQLGPALAPNMTTVLATRFLSGFAGSAPLTNTGGTVADLFTRDDSGAAMAFYSLCSVLGPPSALPLTGYLAQNLGWRWVLLVLTVPETRHNIVLRRKAARLRAQMAEARLASARSFRDVHADKDNDGLGPVLRRHLLRPLHFLFTEPITMFAAAYNGFLYGLVFLFNEAFPLVFGPGGHDFDMGQISLCFLGLTIGPCIAFCFYPLQERYYRARVAGQGGRPVPEARVWMARLGAVFIPVSLFWFAWTSFPSVPWIVPVLASALFGAGIYVIVLSVLNYVVDAYQTYSASALAGVILARNVVGAGFPLFANQMYRKLGNEWASSLLGFLALLLVPIPFVLFYRGASIRSNSPWAREHFDTDEDATH